jgi:hypothetical protein
MRQKPGWKAEQLLEKAMSKKMRGAPWRVLQRGRKWRLGGKYVVLQWVCKIPPEWRNVGWRFVSEHRLKKDAMLEAKVLRAVAEVLES